MSIPTPHKAHPTQFQLQEMFNESWNDAYKILEFAPYNYRPDTDTFVPNGFFNLQFASVSIGTIGDNTIVAANATKRIKVVGAVLVASGSVSIKWKSGAGTDLSGAMPLIANSGFVLPVSSPTNGNYFQTAVNQDLVLNLSGSTAVNGHIVYFLE